MGRFAVVLGCVLVGCLNPQVELDRDQIELPRGTSRDVTIMVNGEPELDYVVWAVDDPDVATVMRSLDGVHLRIGGNHEGETIVHINSHGETIDVPTRVDPPAIVQIWVVPNEVTSMVGELVHVRASALDTMLHVRDISHDAHWVIRDPEVASLDMDGMMLQATGAGFTTLHTQYGDRTTVVPVKIYK